MWCMTQPSTTTQPPQPVMYLAMQKDTYQKKLEKARPKCNLFSQTELISFFLKIRSQT